jgi:hypothetical protein
MPIIHVNAQVSHEQLLRAVEQMPSEELGAFVTQVLALRARRDASATSPEESELIERINKGLPPEFQKNYDELVAKRQAGTLSADEHRELLRLSNEIERLNAERLEHLAQLARLRQTSLPELMHALGIEAPNHA